MATLLHQTDFKKRIEIPTYGGMNLLNHIFGIGDKSTLLDNAPCLAPWHFQADKPKLLRNNESLEWKYVKKVGREDFGVNVLEDELGNCYAIVDTYSYILPSKDNTSFLIWQRTLGKGIGRHSINICSYLTADLEPFQDKNKSILKLREFKQPFLLSGNPSSFIEIDFDPAQDAMKFEFPNDFKEFGEFIMVCELENIYRNRNPEIFCHNTTMLEFKIDTGWIYNYPQDWFNKSNCDYGYQWITRAMRNPQTKLIHGLGIRIPEFVLDETNRNIKA